MEPSEAIAVIETNLRALVHLVMTDEYGANWAGSQLDDATRASLESRMREEAKRRAPAVVTSDLQNYTHLYELRKIITKHWELYKPALGEKRAFDVLMGFVEDYRNAPAHSRTLLQYERAHLEGIAGIIRTQVTKHRSLRGPDMEYYPVFESITDSFGNTWTSDGKEPVWTGVTLDVGDVVTFDIRAWDPQGRDLFVRVIFGVGGIRSLPFAPLDGPIVWQVTGEEVAHQLRVGIYMKSSSAYHREGSFDHAISFYYSVRPPAE
jgi:hypothetical protein